MSNINQNFPDNPHIEVIKSGKTGLFTNYIFKAIPLAFDESMSYYETLCGLLNYLKNVIIPTVNNNANAVTELQNLYVQLHDYVENYFTNLDVQDEINNKLDQMVENGTLQNILNNYTNTTRVYNTHQDMINDTTLVNNQKAKTLGYYSINDGGEGDYYIVDNEPTNSYYETTSNGKYAILIAKNDTINLKQLGGKEIDNDGTKYDNTPYINKYLNFVKNSNKKYKLFIPSGIWCFSEVTFPSASNGIYIYGVNNFNLDYASKGTIITSYNDNQNYLWATSISSSNGVTNFNIENLLFSSADYQFNNTNKVWEVTHIKNIGTCLNIINSGFGIIDNLAFEQINGNALKISSSWEIYYKLLFFRFINALSTDGVMIIDNVSEYHSTDGFGTNASSFDNIMFEAVHGDLIKIKSGSIFGNSNFKNINFEDFRYTLNGTYTNAESNTNTHDGTFTINSIFNIEDNAYLLPIYIENIELNNFAKNIYAINNNKYIYDTIINLGSNIKGIITINNVNCHGMYKNLNIISNYPEKQMAPTFKFTINNINCTGKNTDDISAIFDVYGFKKINSGNVNLNFDTTDSATSSTDNRFNTIIPFYSIAYINANLNKGFLYYDSECNNKLKLAVSPKNADVSGDSLYSTFIKSGNTIKLRAKIPLNETYKFIINDRTHNGVLTVTGSGNYEMYTIDITNLEFGKECRFLKSPDSTTDNVYLDWFIMY